MKTKIFKIIVVSSLLIMFFNISTVFASDSETPPSLNIDIPDEEDEDDTPPSVDIEIPADDDDNNPSPPANDPVEITSHSVFPKGFNPTITDTEITFRISERAKIELRIDNSKGQTVLKIVENETLSAGEHEYTWYGTDNNSKTGKVVAAGEYTYKIIARNSVSNLTEDTVEGRINIIVPATPQNNNQAQATVVMQNTQSGQTAETGPGILIYSVFPLAGYLISRKFKK